MERPVNLSAREFQLLRFLIQHRGETVSRDVLLRDVWGDGAKIYTRTVDMRIASLRQQLEDDPKQPKFILTVQGLGYKLSVYERSFAKAISTAIVIPSAIIVAALALLQYRWSTRISEATSVRLADSLQMSMMNWQKDFFRYFSEIGLALRIDPVEDAPGDAGQYVRRFAEWKAVAKYPKLVSGVYLLKSDATAHPQALRLNSQARRFEPADWPPQFEPLRQDLRRFSAEFLRDRASQQPYELFDMAGWRFDPGIPALFHPSHHWHQSRLDRN